MLVKNTVICILLFNYVSENKRLAFGLVRTGLVSKSFSLMFLLFFILGD